MTGVWRAAGAAILAAGLASTAAEARQFYVDDSNPAERKCYVKTFVPAKVRVNTEGQLVRPAKKTWVVTKVGAQEQWTLVSEPAVYIETREVVEAAHYTLRRVSCDSAPVAKAAQKPKQNCYRSGGDRVICEPVWN